MPETKINKTARNVKMVQSTVITRRTLESGLAAGRGPPGLKEYAPSMVMNILFEGRKRKREVPQGRQELKLKE